MITPEDDIMVRTIERAVGQRITRQTIAGFDYNAPAPAFTPSPLPQRGRQPMHQSRQPQRQGAYGAQSSRQGARPQSSGQPGNRSPRRDRGDAR